MAALRIRSIEPEEAKRTSELIARVFPRDPSYVRLTTWYKWMLRHPDHRWEYVRVVELDGRIVSHLLLVERHIRVRHGVLKAAGLSVVATLQEFQRQGLNRKLIEEALAFASKSGFAVSLLDGIPDYYDRYGYVVVMPKYEIRVQTREALRLEREMEVLEVDARQAVDWLADISEIYSREVDGLIGPAERSEGYWSWLLQKGGKLLVARSGDRALAYCWIDDNPAVVEEAAGSDPSAVRSLIAVLGRKAKEAVAPEIRLNVHPDAAFGRNVVQDVGAEVGIRYPRNAGWMGRILDLVQVLRASVGWSSKERLNLCFETDLGEVGVRRGPGGVVVEPGPCAEGTERVKGKQGALLQLVFGYASVPELRERGQLQTSEKTAATLAQLFPKVNPGLFARDHF